MLLYVIYGLLVITNFLFVPSPAEVVVTPAKLFHRQIFDARLRFFMSPDKAFLSRNSTDYSREELLLGGIETILRFALYLGFFFTETFFLGVLPVTMWTVAKNFEEFISSITNTNFGQLNVAPVRKLIRQKFEEVKTFSRSVNSIWSVLNMVWVLDHSMRIMFQLNDSVSTRDALNLISMVFSLFFWATALILTAEVFRKVS